MEMTSRQRLLAALNHQETDQMAWSPLMDNYFFSSASPEKYNGEIILLMKELGIDILERHVAGLQEIYTNVEISHLKVDGKERVLYSTPVGEIYTESVPTGQTVFTSKHLVESLEDMRVFQYMVEHTAWQSREYEFKRRDLFIGDSGLAVPSGPMSPIQEMLQFLAGIENTIYLLEDYPTAMAELLDAIHQRNLAHYDKLCSRYDCPLIVAYEDTSTTVMSPDMYRQFSAPAIEDYTKVAHKYGKIFITHMCGKLSLLASDLDKGSMDGIDSLCPPTTGDFYCWDAREKLPNKIIIGGIEPPALSRMSVRESLDTVAEIITKLPYSEGFILSTGDAVPYGTPWENIRAISDYLGQIKNIALKGQNELTVMEQIVTRYS